MQAASGNSEDRADAFADQDPRAADGPAEQPPADARLLEGLRGRSPEALAMVVQNFNSTLMRAAWLYLGDAHSAEDAVQETYLAAWDAAGRTGDRTSLRAWLAGILVNRCRKHIRQALRRRRRERQADAMPKPSAGDASQERVERLQSALAGMDALHREVVILRYWQGMSVDETAAALDVPAGTVKSRCHAALAMLRKELEHEDE